MFSNYFVIKTFVSKGQQFKLRNSKKKCQVSEVSLTW